VAFPPSVVERLLVACHRHCCICHKPAGNKMEIHHIVPKAEGGEDSEENGIPLCFNCHAEVEHYNPQHPRGRRFTATELREHKKQWFAICARAPWEETLREPSGAVAEIADTEIADIDESMFRDLRLDDRTPAEKLVAAVMQQDRPKRRAFAGRVFEGLQAEDEEIRWKFAMVVEELLLWELRLVPLDILETMSEDESFSVRSSAAVCYYYLAKLEPALRCP
jgi:hypothetical protein